MSLDHDDYATLARIEDHLRRIADALERAHPKFNPGGYVGADYTLPEMPSCGYGRVATREEIRAFLSDEPCDDRRTCTNRDPWAPVGRINHGSADFEQCVHGQDHTDSLTCEYRCAATMPGHWCTRREHADDRHVWAMSDAEAERHMREEDWFADPLDEDDHRARHDRDGAHIVWGPCGHWHSPGYLANARKCWMDTNSLATWSATYGPLTFCDCDDAATIEAENGATD